MNSMILFEKKIENEEPPIKNEGNNENNGVFSQGGILSYPIERLIKKYLEGIAPRPKGEVTTIHVDEIASKIAFFYEKVRKIIDWKEDNLLRRNAIVRILKRNLVSEISHFKFIFKIDINKIAEPLVLELIRGGHLPNDEVPEEKIGKVDNVLKKYFYILQNAPYSTTNSNFIAKKKVNFFEWILEVAACEIEEVLAFPVKENALIETMTVLMNERIKIVPQDKITDDKKIIQVYIAVHRTLYDLDDAIIAYHLLKYQFQEWTNPSEEFIKEITQNIFSIWDQTQDDLSNPLKKEFFSICEKTDTSFTLLGDILDYYKKEPHKISEAVKDRESLKELISQFYKKRLATLKNRLLKIAIFSSLSVFISNWFTYFIIEVPLAYLVYERFSFVAIIVDFLLPTLAMFILVAIIKPPPASNLNKVVELTFSFVYSDEDKKMYEIKLQKKRRPLTNFIIALIYFVVTLVFFGVVARVFYLARIPATSIVLDTLMIAVNVFAALVVRNKAREITVEEKSSFGEFLLDIISIPAAEVGSWLGNKWREYNIVGVFFNVVIETPFVTVVEFIEDWRNFLKEKKAEIH